MNPYDFVRVEWNNPGQRREALPADRFGGISGHLEGTITALTPILIPDTHAPVPRPFLRNRRGEEIIPGSSLKGLFRSVVETVSGGAWWFINNANLPHTFTPPQDINHLDAACRMFGFLKKEKVLQGRVYFEDAVCTYRRDCLPFYTCILSSPKPRHTIWYLDTNRQWVAGRKFYFHTTELQTAQGWLPRNAEIGRRQNQYIKPLDEGSVFTFRAQFTNLDQDDFALLLYALVLEENVRHKLGYAKPAGLGSVHVQLTKVELIDHIARYRAGREGRTCYEKKGDQENTLEPFIENQTRIYTSNMNSVTLQDIRRIWKWPPVHTLRYPTQDWFTSNPTTPINQTP